MILFNEVESKLFNLNAMYALYQEYFIIVRFNCAMKFKILDIYLYWI